MPRFAIGTIASLGAFFFAYWLEGGAMRDFVLPSVLLIVLLVPLFAVLAVWKARELADAWKAAFAKGRLAEERRMEGASLWDFYEKSSYAAGLVGTLAGFIIIFATPGYEPRVFSIALVCVLEGILLGLVARILRARVEKAARADRA